MRTLCNILPLNRSKIGYYNFKVAPKSFIDLIPGEELAK